MEFFAAHNGVAAAYDERGDAIAFDTAAEARKDDDMVTKRPHNFLLGRPDEQSAVYRRQGAPWARYIQKLRSGS